MAVQPHEPLMQVQVLQSSPEGLLSPSTQASVAGLQFASVQDHAASLHVHVLQPSSASAVAPSSLQAPPGITGPSSAGDGSVDTWPQALAPTASRRSAMGGRMLKIYSHWVAEEAFLPAVSLVPPGESGRAKILPYHPACFSARAR